jgi:hypothetical protein
MSTAAVIGLHALPTPAEQQPERERHLRALPAIAPRRAPRLVHGVVGLIGLVGIIVAQLGLSVAISEGAYRLSALQGESTALARTEQTLAEEIAVLSSPQHVAVAAGELGMLAGQPSQFLTLADTATAGGPDALHMQVAAVDAFGMHVPNALLAEAPHVPAAVQQGAAVRPHPGMLLPAGVTAAQAAGEAADGPAPGTLLTTPAGE